MTWSFDCDVARRTFPAALASVALHGALFLAVAAGVQVLPEAAPVGPLRLTGQTFDVETIGSSEQPDPDRPSGSTDENQTESAESAQNSEPTESTEGLEDSAADDDLDGENDQTDAPEEHDQATLSDLAADEFPEELPPTPSASDHPAPQDATTNVEPVDPFELSQLPGEPTLSGALPPHTESGRYGAEGAESGPTNVYKAFLHQFPDAAHRDSAWEHLPTGPAGTIEFTLTIGADGRSLHIDILKNPEGASPPYLRRAVELTARYLRHRPLAWSVHRRAGSERMILTATIKRRAPDPDTPGARGIADMGLSGQHRPSEAYFTFYSGQHVEIDLHRLP